MTPEAQLLAVRVVGAVAVGGAFVIAFTVFKDNGPAAAAMTGLATGVLSWLGIKSPLTALHKPSDDGGAP